MIRAISLIHRRRIFRRRRIVSPPPHYVSAAALCKRRRIVSPSPHCSLFCCVMLNGIHIFLSSLCTVHHGSELHCNQSLMIRAIALIHRRRIVSPPPHWVTAAALSHRRRIVNYSAAYFSMSFIFFYLHYVIYTMAVNSIATNL